MALGDYKSPGIAAMVAEGQRAAAPRGGLSVPDSTKPKQKRLEIKEAADGTFTLHWYGDDGEKTASAPDIDEALEKAKAFFTGDEDAEEKETPDAEAAEPAPGAAPSDTSDTDEE